MKETVGSHGSSFFNVPKTFVFPRPTHPNKKNVSSTLASELVFAARFFSPTKNKHISENVFIHLRNWTNINTPKNDALKQVISNSFTIWQLLLDIHLLNFRWVCITLVVSRSMHGVCCDVSGKTFTWKADINYGWLLGLTAPVFLLHLFAKIRKSMLRIINSNQ